MNCIQCKGKYLCSRPFCPFQVNYKVIQKESFDGSSPPQVFIGSKLYPRANVGILSPPEKTEDSWIYNSPNYWTQNKYTINEIVNLRKNLINSRFETSIKESSKFLDISKEIAMSYKPVDVEIELQKKPFVNQKFDTINMPVSIASPLKKVKITSNPKIHQKVDKAVNDTDLKANEAILYLKDSFDEHFLTQLISIGVLGLKHNRKLVPTRWSIVCVDSTLGNDFINKIKEYKESNYLIYFGGCYGNYFLVMFFPEIWSYELFEMYMPEAIWNQNNKISYTTDYENYYGRKTYAKNCAGGYYSNRLAVLEKLENLKRQASVLVIRFTTKEYTTNLGVWVVREATREALRTKPIEFNSKENMLKYAEFLIHKKFNYNLFNTTKESIILKNINQQCKLSKFFTQHN
ncbi:MAG: hypothetical protein V1663_00715 [archaeon]